MTTRKKLLIYKLLLFALAFVLAFLPSTAARNMEVNGRVIVEALGLDMSDSDLIVTAQYVVPAQGDSATEKQIVSVSRSTLGDALEALNIALGRRAELGHCSMVVIGEGTDPDTVANLLTSTDITADAYLSAAEKSAAELMKNVVEFMKKTNATDADFIAYSEKKSHVATTTLLNFLSDISSASHTAAVPIVSMNKGNEPDQKSENGGQGENGGEQNQNRNQGKGNEQSNQKESKQGGEGGGQSGGEAKQDDSGDGMSIEKIALYNRLGRAGVLSGDGARGVAWTRDETASGNISAKIIDGERDFGVISAKILSKRISIKIANGKARVKVSAKVSAKGYAVNKIMHELDNARAVIEESFAKTIERDLNAAFNGSLVMGCDPLFVAREFYRKTPAYYDNEFTLNAGSAEFEAKVKLE